MMHSLNQHLAKVSKASPLHMNFSKKLPWQFPLASLHDLKHTSHGHGFGASVGASVGAAVGAFVGAAVGAAVGALVGSGGAMVVPVVAAQAKATQKMVTRRRAIFCLNKLKLLNYKLPAVGALVGS